MIHFKYDSYERKQNQKPVREYLDNMTEYLFKLHGNKHSKSEIRQFVISQIEDRLSRPSVKQIYHKSPGNSEIRDVDLLGFTECILKDQIIVPSGTTYCRPDKQVSLFKAKINDDMASRKVEKKLMFKAKAAKDEEGYDLHYGMQTSIKIGVNSLPGAMGSEYNPLFDLAGYNAITSLGRYSVMVGYAYVERMIEANVYLPTLDIAINYVVTHCKVCPQDDVRETLQNGILLPSVEDVVDYLLGCVGLYKYVTNEDHERMYNLIASISEEERAFVYYAGCLKHLAMKNEHIFRPNLNQMFKTNIDPSGDIRPEQLNDIDGVAVMFATTLNHKLLENVEQIYDTVTDQPEIARKVVASAINIETVLETAFGKIFETYMRSHVCIHNILSHPHMVRKCVIVSDTDSVIFTIHKWVTWWMGHLSFDREAYSIVAFVSYVLTKVLEHAFAQMSANVGMIGEDIYKTQMKNEFLYPVMLRTAAAKHYAGLVAVQEGVVLPKLDEDIKGKMLRGSDLPNVTVEAVTEFIRWIMQTICEESPLLAGEAIGRTISFERKVYNSLVAGEKTFLPIYPVKPITDYEHDPYTTKYFYYELWESVFAEKYGHIVVPNKVYGIPVRDDGRAIRSPRFLEKLKTVDGKMYNNLMAFLEKYPQKKISFVLIPPSIVIPDIIRQLIDIRSIVYTNSQPFYLMLRSLGIVINDKKTSVTNLISDFYIENPIDR